MVIQSIAAPNVKWYIRGACLTDEEVDFIRNYNPTVYHHDLECYLWAFDTKMPSGRWLENIRFNNAMSEARAYVEPKEGCVMSKNTGVAIISIDDVVHTLKECDRDWKYSGAAEHMMLFASELTGLSTDALSEMMYPD